MWCYFIHNILLGKVVDGECSICQRLYGQVEDLNAPPPPEMDEPVYPVVYIQEKSE